MLGFVCELTAKCNLNCRFCYNTWRDPEVSIPDALEPQAFSRILIKTLKESRAHWLAFAGGEPILYPQLPELMAAVHQELPHIKIGLSSNGTTLTPQRLLELKPCGLQYVEISLFASSAERYQNLTGRNLLDHAHAAILAVKEQGFPLTIACTLLADGLSEFENVVLTAMSLGADAFAMNPFTPTGYGQKQTDALVLSHPQIQAYLDMAEQLAKRMPTLPFTVTLPIEDCVISHARYPHLNFSRCVCGEKKWVIDPQGYLRTCEQNPMRIGNLATHSFTELSQQNVVHQFRSQNRFSKCAACEQYNECGGGCRFRYT